MELLKTKFGELYIKNKTILDTEKHILFNDCDNLFIETMKEEIEKAQDIGDWLSQFENVCWGTNKNKLMSLVADYVRNDEVVFDKEWFNDNYNKIGKTYVLFEYSECWRERY